MAVIALTAIGAGGWDAAALAEGNDQAAASVPFGQPRPGSFDDGWRRTASGWEHIASWPTFARAAAAVGRDEQRRISTIPHPEHLALLPGRRLDFHPAALALLLVMVVFGLTSFSRPAGAA